MDADHDPPATGRLWSTWREATRRALADGSLEPVATECHALPRDGTSWLVRVLGPRDSKGWATAAQRRSGENPFLPYDPGVFVADVSATHVALLNKFNVLDHHLLLVTREFRSQDDALDVDDFHALWTVLSEVDGLGFYNGGTLAGASQPHKHLQVVTVPLGPGVPPIPIEPVIAGSIDDPNPRRCGTLPFPHALASTAGLADLDPRAAAEASVELTRRLRVRAEGGGAPAPYNLLITRRFALWVPRRLEQWEGIPINALGFAGSLMVRDAEGLERVRRAGPLGVLAAVAGPEGGS